MRPADLPDGRFYYAMKLVRGTRLDAYLQRTPHLPDRLRIFQRICEPVAFAHARGVIHRDLKPANIMVGEFGEVLVMDWGAPGMGTEAFMAPEQAVDDVVDGRADVFALGRILEVLVTQDVRVAKPLASICRCATEQDRSQRYAGPLELAADIAAYLDRMPVSAHRGRLEESGWTVRLAQLCALLALVAAYVAMKLPLFVARPLKEFRRTLNRRCQEGSNEQIMVRHLSRRRTGHPRWIDVLVDSGGALTTGRDRSGVHDKRRDCRRSGWMVRLAQ